MKLLIKPLTAEQVRQFLGWQYPGPYAMYNMSPENEEADIRFFLDPANGYFGISAEAGELLGFCNFGVDARVPGGDYAAQAVDIGMGLRPDLTGKGQGAVYAAAVFAFAQEQYPRQRQRVTIAKFNERAQRLCRKFGFSEAAQFVREQDGQEFVVMMREA